MTDSTTVISSIYQSGRVYDLLFPFPDSGLGYWSSLAQEYGDPILEIMCGTGAVAIPLAQQGYRVTGVDMAEPMLVEAERKSKAAGVAVEWVRGDVRNFDLGRRFKFIYLPSNSICHLLMREDLEACLATVARHLDRDGRFSVTVFVPSLPLLMKPLAEEQEFGDYLDPGTGEKVVWTNYSWYDPAMQTKYNPLYKRVGSGPRQPDGELTLRMYFPQELDALFWYNGFAIEHKYGGPDRRPFDAEAGMQYFVLSLRD